MVKDKYGNNLRRGNRVKDVSDGERGQGTVVGTYDTQAVVVWDDDGEEDAVKSQQLILIDRAFR